MKTSLPLLAFAGLAVSAGLLHGWHTGRWRPSADVAGAAERLNNVPLSLGDWRGEADTLDTEDLKRAGIKGHLSARFRNVVTGEKVSVLLVCGHPGPISVHTPETCYGGAGFEPAGARYRKQIPVGAGRSVAVWAMRFKAPRTAAPGSIEVNWAWTGGGGWVAPENPRVALAGYPALYKLYVVRDVPAVGGQPPRDPSVDFLQTYLPELEKVLARGEGR